MPEQLHIQINYLPGLRLWRWQIRKMSEDAGFVYDVDGSTFVSMVFYARNVKNNIATAAMNNLEIVKLPDGHVQWKITKLGRQIMEGQQTATGSKLVEVEGSYTFVLSPVEADGLMNYLNKLVEIV
jgi:hypothetical protein